MERKSFTCKRCGWQSYSSMDKPRCCARCKNSYWDTEPIMAKRKVEAITVEEITSTVEEGLNALQS